MNNHTEEEHNGEDTRRAANNSLGVWINLHQNVNSNTNNRDILQNHILTIMLSRIVHIQSSKMRIHHEER